MIYCSFLKGTSLSFFAKFTIALLNKTGNSWKSLHAVIAKLRHRQIVNDDEKEIFRLANSYGIQEDELWLAENLIERVQADGWQISFYSSDEYPQEWLQYGEKSPPLIFLKGNMKKKPFLWIAIVGTIQPDSTTSSLVKNTVEILSKFDCGIVTGGAPGVDTISAETAITQKIPVRIILPMGSLHYAPMNIILEATEQGYCQIISPWTPNSKWCKSQAVRRNLLIAYSASTAFVFNPSHEGGSFRVAKNLFARNLPVFVYMPEKYAWYLRYSKYIYPISTDHQNLNTERIEKVLDALYHNLRQNSNSPLELF